MLARIAKRTGLWAEDLCKAQWDAGDVAKHFRRFCEVELKCCGPWETEDQTHQKRAAYFAFMLEGPARPDVTALEDANRGVGVYALAIERFLSHVLQDCMEKGQSEVGTFGESYQIVRRYFG